MMVLWLMVIVLSWPTTKAATQLSNVKDGCKEKCGDVSVPYPFGIDDSRCAMNETGFLLTCDYSATPNELIFEENVVVLNISLEEGIIVASIEAASLCYSESGLVLEADSLVPNISLGDGPFRFSDTRNKLTAFGCDTLAGIIDDNQTFGSFCGNLCSDVERISTPNITGDSCSGIGCCQVPIPKSLKTFNFFMRSVINLGSTSQFSRCDYAILADENSNFSEFWQSTLDSEKSVKSNVSIEWVIKEASVDSSPYTGEENTICTYHKNGQGYRCSCKEGFQGNPYLPNGCQDIDECKEPKLYPCQGTCKNNIGNYTCDCPFGMHGDGKVSCHGWGIIAISAVSGGSILAVITIVLAFIVCKQRRKERNFLKNGGGVLKHQHVRIFEETELEKATKNYDKNQFLGEGSLGFVYKGILPDNTHIAVKKLKEMDEIQMNEEFYHEIGVVARVNHKNVVKPLGLCLESKVPLLVYEFVANKTLFHHIHDKSSQILRTWYGRLRIAVEIALALDYLHSLANPPIIHGNIKSTNIFLDDSGTVKVADFGTSIVLSPGLSLMITKVKGTFGYLDPEYLMTSSLTEKSDVYSFGVVLVELLTGVKPGSVKVSAGEKTNIIEYFISSIVNNSLYEVLGFGVACKDEMDEIEIVAGLAKRCLRSSGIKRPTMKQVVEVLAGLKKRHENVRAQQNSTETDYLLGASSHYNPAFETAMTVLPDPQL